MSSTQELNQICNIAGYPMYDWAIAQLQQRSKVLSNPNRTEDQINYLGNKGAWIRVVSSVNLEDSFIKYFKDQYGIDAGEDSLAKKFMLFGGTSTYESGLRSGINTGGSYAILGDTEVNAYGYKPMPGITSVTIESTGRMGSVRQATVNFRVSDKMQLDVMDALYFRPGFTLLIEYGHAKYIDNNGNLQSTEQYMIDPFKATNKKTPDIGATNKENIGIKISRNVQKSAGNYGGMLSIITSFNFSITPDGGYDCVLRTIAMGGVMGNYPVNKLSILPNVYVESVKKYLNKEKEKKIAEARAAAAAEIAAVQAASNKPGILNDNWGNTLISDKLANLIHGTDPSILKEASVAPPPQREYVDEGLANATVAPQLLFFPENSKAAITKIVNTYKEDNKINTSNPATIGIPIPARQTPIAIFIESPFGPYESLIDEKYIATVRDNASIYIKIDPDYILTTLANSKKFSSEISATQAVNVNGQSIPFTEYENWIDIIYSKSVVTQPATPAAPKQEIVVLNLDKTAQNGVSFFNYKNQNVNYRLGASISGVQIKGGNTIDKNFNYNSGLNLFLNKDTQYKVTAIEKNRSDNKYTVWATAIGLPSNEEYTVAFDDLAFISDIIGEQNLSKNTSPAPVIEARKRAAQMIADIVSKFELDTNAKTLKAIANSQSALELMLRSIMLYAIENNGTAPMTPKFLKDLFSEGAYSDIFKNGAPQQKSYEKTDFDGYIRGSIDAKKRLEINFRYGNSAYLLGAENVPDNANLLEIIPQVDFKTIFNIISIPYGQTADIFIENAPQKSVYISLGFFFMMLNHTGMLYNSSDENDVRVPVTYVDFNPATNYYLSSINQFSIDPFKYLLPYRGSKSDYKKLFRKDILRNDDTIELKLDRSPVQPHSIFKFGKGVDQISPLMELSNNKKDVDGKISNGYISRTMDTMVNINHLLDIIKTRSTADDFGEAYFQSILENIIASLNKSTGYYNAFRLSYSDSSNVFMIVDDHVQVKPDARLNTIISSIIDTGKNSPEIPIQGKGSIARSFDIRTDISSRIASMIAISTNPGLGNQVGMSKNTSDFGVYNTGSYDRYMKVKTSDGSSTATNENATLSIQSNVQECQAAINFDTVVSSMYGLGLSTGNTEYIKPEEIEQAAAYYKEKMSRVKNEQAGSVAAMIIPIKSSITMDGFSGIYPFQLFTINENTLPYRYSQANLKNSKVAFSTARLSHNFSNNEWTTSIEGFMTFLKKSDDQKTSRIEASTTLVLPVVTTTATTLPYKETVQKVINALKANGFNKAVAAAFLGNMEVETGGFNNSVIFSDAPDPQNSEINYGLIQWQKERRTAIKKEPDAGNTIESQVNFIKKELDGTTVAQLYTAYTKAKTSLAAVQDSESGVAVAVQILIDDYVLPNKGAAYKSALERRATSAVEFYKQIQNGTYVWL
jgi:hypothetical protein